jgi:hypothetical protein
MKFATSDFGTFETCRRTLKMSAYWGHRRTVKTTRLTLSGQTDAELDEPNCPSLVGSTLL